MEFFVQFSKITILFVFGNVTCVVGCRINAQKCLAVKVLKSAAILKSAKIYKKGKYILKIFNQSKPMLCHKYIIIVFRRIMAQSSQRGKRKDESSTEDEVAWMYLSVSGWSVSLLTARCGCR